MINRTGTQQIETPRLILRPFRVEDAEDMFMGWASDSEVTRFLTWPAHSGVEVTCSLLTAWTVRYEDGGFFNWAMEWKENGRVIGNISVVKLNEGTESADIGYCMSRAFWGRGIMPEALRAVMDFLFDTVGLNRIAACHDIKNPKSGRVMEKAGMKIEGILRGAGRNNRGICDEVWYAALKGDRNPLKKKETAGIQIRFARDEDLESVNILRKQVNDLHVAGKPEVFRSGFCDALRNYIHEIWQDPRKRIVVAEKNGSICGFAVLNHITRPENPFMFERDYMDVDEFGVAEGQRRQGVATAMIEFIMKYTKEEGLDRLELNMWEFNRNALAFYETVGFRTYRRYMEIKL